MAHWFHVTNTCCTKHAKISSSCDLYFDLLCASGDMYMFGEPLEYGPDGSEKKI